LAIYDVGLFWEDASTGCLVQLLLQVGVDIIHELLS